MFFADVLSEPSRVFMTMPGSFSVMACELVLFGETTGFTR
jgi:hypothetical protein